MHDASSSTTPSSLGSPPSPTAWSSGSSSSMLTPAIIASRVSAFCRMIISYARATPRMPLPDATTTGGPANSDVPTGRATPRSSTSARAFRSSVSVAAAAAPAPINFRLEIDTLIPPEKLNGSPLQRLELPALVLWMLVSRPDPNAVGLSVPVDLDGNLSVTGHPPAVHPRSIERRGDISLPIHRDHAAPAFLFHELFHHDVVRRLLEGDSSVANAGADVGRNVIANVKLAIAST